MSDDWFPVWRSKYEKDAYTDQTGASQWGTVVYERRRIRKIGTEPWDDPYHPGQAVSDGIKVYADEAGRVYLSYPIIDYCGRWSARCQDDDTFWERPSVNLRGHVTPEGEPVFIP